MKFMKLGSRPDTFYTTEAVRSVSSEVSSDLIVEVKGSRFLLHKFPLLSKSLRLQRLCSDSPESSQIQLIKLHDFPGGVEAFELCAKFCYGITITLSAFNIVSIRCAAEYLQMTEEVDKGNMIHKVEVFFNSCILNGWRDSVLTLQTTRAFPLLSEELGVTGRCIEAVASKVLAHPEKVSLSNSSNGSESHRHRHRPKGWWGEDLAELGIDLYWRSMVAIKSGGKVPSSIIGDALRVYASRWLPNLPKSMEGGGGEADYYEGDSKHRLILESMVSLLPPEKNSVSCSFLLKLLKAANILKASVSSKTELARRVGLQLEEASVADLLLPQSSSSHNDTVYDVDAVMTILEEFMSQGRPPTTTPPRGERRGAERRRSRSAEDTDLEFQDRRRSSSASHGSKLKAAKLVDGYLQEVAKDKNLPLHKFIAIAEAIPDFARLNHDDLYKAIDIYLKEHPELCKSDRKRLCRILDCKKLSVEACMHAAQNEMLPLRVVVQVLFFEQARAAMVRGQVTALPSNIKVLLEGRTTPSKGKASFSTNATMPPDDQWSASGLKKLSEDHDLERNTPGGVAKSLKIKSLSMMPSRPRRLFSKFWATSRSAGEKN